MSQLGNGLELEDLFHSLTFIAFPGTFQSACSYAEELKQWLLVNIQNDCFESQLLTRYPWTDKTLRNLMKGQFTLWQVDCELSEGRRFVTLYHCLKMPYVCVIDPRTGEEMWNSVNPTPDNFLTGLQNFLQEHKHFSLELTAVDESGPSTANRRAHSIMSLGGDEEFTGNSHYDEDRNVRKCIKLMEVTEEEQIAPAIHTSMRENGINGDGNSTTQEDMSVDEEEEIENYYDTYKFLNATGSDEVVKLFYPSNTLVKVLRKYIQQVHPHIPKNGYKLICVFPSRILEKIHDDCSLEEIGLHPSANLHITWDD
uniref:UAS domain-containing protein n=1 Tax=Glossina brevipalpis TaxID=37001 RepID=A0A1A9WPW4_9MUSC